MQSVDGEGGGKGVFFFIFLFFSGPPEEEAVAGAIAVGGDWRVSADCHFH